MDIRLNSNITKANSGNKPNLLDDVIEQIGRDLGGQISPARIREVAAEVAARFKDARITAYLPIFIRRRTCERLKKEILRDEVRA